LVVEDVEFGLFEWWCYFVFDDFVLCVVVDWFVVVFEGFDVMYVEVY